MRRAVILGNERAGKSTVARALSHIYQLPHIDLDHLTTGTYPPVTGEAFVRRVHAVLAQPKWIIDGDYQRRLDDMVISQAELAVWLDLPFRVSLLAAHPSLRVVHLRSQKQVDAWLATQPSSQLGTFANAGAGEGSNHRSRSAMTSQ